MVSDFDIDKMYCGAIRRGDVFLCNLNKKEQAILILQDDILNQGLPTIVCVLIEPYKQDEDIFPNEVLLKDTETGLGKDGICMLHKIVTINRHNIFAKKGELILEKMKEVYTALDVNLGRFRD
jgi:mRNA-degrading endonuclease toxin of MazEF toxin-antitoxin module